MNTDDPDFQEFDDLPQGLVDALQSADRRPAVITSRVDREITALAAGQFAGRGGARRSRPALGGLVGMVAMAASVLIAVAAVLSVFRGAPDIEGAEVYADIDGSGRIDIADVLAVARDARSNGVPQAQIDAFAARIVKLDGGGDAT